MVMNKLWQKMWRMTFCFFIFCSFLLPNSNQGFAQEGGSTGVLGDSLRDLYTVAGVGVAGSVLGLSTLSFVEEPGENLKNIVTGGAIGIILGVGVVAWKHASRSKDAYDTSETKSPDNPIKKDFFAGSELFSKSNTKKGLASLAPMVRYNIHF